MALEIKNVILLGGTSILGQRFVEYITTIENPFNITITSRSPTPPAWVPSTPNFKIVDVDFTSHESLVSALRGQDAAVAILGYGTVALQPKVVEAAIEAGVKLFIPSEFGMDTTRNNPNLDRALALPISFLKVKADNSTAFLKRVEDGSIKHITIQTGPFFEWSLGNGFLGFNFKERKATIFNGGNVPNTAITTKKIGEAIVRLLLNPTPYINKPVYISTITYTQNDLLRIVEEKTGEKWTVQEMTGAEAIELGKKVASVDHMVSLVMCFSGLFYDPVDKFVVYEKDYSDELGLGKEDIGAVIDDVLAETKAQGE